MTPHSYSRITGPIQHLLRWADHIQAHRVAWRAFELAGRLRESWTIPLPAGAPAQAFRFVRWLSSSQPFSQ